MSADAGCWLHPGVTVERSAIAGRGLFATVPIPAGTAVSRVGELPPGVPHRFGNHGCEPNLWWDGPDTLVARRDIAAGEELTYDYATSTADPRFLLRCHCGSSRCRQMVTGDDWRIRELQAVYAGHWAPALQRLIDAAP